LPTVALTLSDNFSAADTDHSGGLSLAEAQARVPSLDANIFNTLDANHDGQLTTAELQQYLDEEGEGESQSVVVRELNDNFTAADTDNSGGLSLAEAQARVPSLDASTFNVLDADHDGQLTTAELQRYLDEEGEGESPSVVAQELNDNFTAADTDSSGGLSLAEAQAYASSLDANTFNTLDANHDGQLTQAELQQYLGTNSGGCNCASQKGAFDLKGRLGDLLLAGLGLMVIVLMSRKVG